MDGARGKGNGFERKGREGRTRRAQRESKGRYWGSFDAAQDRLLDCARDDGGLGWGDRADERDGDFRSGFQPSGSHLCSLTQGDALGWDRARRWRLGSPVAARSGEAGPYGMTSQKGKSNGKGFKRQGRGGKPQRSQRKDCEGRRGARRKSNNQCGGPSTPPRWGFAQDDGGMCGRSRGGRRKGRRGRTRQVRRVRERAGVRSPPGGVRID